MKTKVKSILAFRSRGGGNPHQRTHHSPENSPRTTHHSPKECLASVWCSSSLGGPAEFQQLLTVSTRLAIRILGKQFLLKKVCNFWQYPICKKTV